MDYIFLTINITKREVINVDKLCNIITTLAVFALMVAMCTIDSNLIGSLVILFIAGAWLAGYAYQWEEKRRKREGRGIR